MLYKSSYHPQALYEASGQFHRKRLHLYENKFTFFLVEGVLIAGFFSLPLLLLVIG